MVAPWIYFWRMSIGFFEGIDSERGIAWRVADSLSLWVFLGYRIDESTPDHVSISRTRRLIEAQTHQKVFSWVLEQLAQAGLVQGKTMGVDSTTLEANAAMKSIVWPSRRVTRTWESCPARRPIPNPAVGGRERGENYLEFLRREAAAEGEAVPDAAA